MINIDSYIADLKDDRYTASVKKQLGSALKEMLKSIEEKESSNLNNYIFCGPDWNGQLNSVSIIAEVLYEAGKVKSKEIVALSQEELRLFALSNVEPIYDIFECAIDCVLLIDTHAIKNICFPSKKFDIEEEQFSAIIDCIEKYRDRVCVVFSTSQQIIKKFDKYYPDMKSYFPHRIYYHEREIASYLQMFENLVANFDMILTEEAKEIMLRAIPQTQGLDLFNTSNKKVFDLFYRCLDTKNHLMPGIITAGDIGEFIPLDVDIADHFCRIDAFIDYLEVSLSAKEKVRALVEKIANYNFYNNNMQFVFEDVCELEVVSDSAEIIARALKLKKFLRTDCVEIIDANDLSSNKELQPKERALEICREALNGVLVIKNADYLLGDEVSIEVYKAISEYVEEHKRIIGLVLSYPKEAAKRMQDLHDRLFLSTFFEKFQIIDFSGD